MNFEPTLAETFDPITHGARYWVQAKIDGVRCIATRENGSIVLYTRHGNLISGFENIKNELDPILNDGDFLDGELFNPDLTFEQICSAVKKGFDNLRFIVFDFIQRGKEELLFSARWNALQIAFVGLKYISPVEQLERRICGNKAIEQATRYFVERGFEGAILRTESKHEGGRNETLLKNKPFQDAEFKMTGFETTNKGRSVALLVTDSGKPFKASCVQACARFVKKKVTVRFQGMTAKGLPRFARVITARDYE